MLPRAPGIYCIRNIANNKRYIGQTYDLHYRKRKHFSALEGSRHPNRHLQFAYNKYGTDKFIFEVLEIMDDSLSDLLEILCSKEQYWMDLYKSCNSEYGYNIHSSSLSAKGTKRTEETKRKISVSHQGVRFSDSHKANMSKAIQEGYDNGSRRKSTGPGQWGINQYYTRKRASFYIITDPNNQIYACVNLKEFCREFSLVETTLRRILKKASNQKDRKGYSIRYMSPEEIFRYKPLLATNLVLWIKVLMDE